MHHPCQHHHNLLTGLTYTRFQGNSYTGLHVRQNTEQKGSHDQNTEQKGSHDQRLGAAVFLASCARPQYTHLPINQLPGLDSITTFKVVVGDDNNGANPSPPLACLQLAAVHWR